MNPGDTKDKPILTLGVASDLSGIQSHSIQQYVNNSLIIPYKLDSRRHLFSQSDISRLENIISLLHEKGLNFAGIRSLLAMIPCWAVLGCPNEVKENCGAYLNDLVPCWEASGKKIACKNENCRQCDVYKCLNNSTDLKSVLRKLLKD